MNVRHLITREVEQSVRRRKHTYLGHLSADELRAIARARITLPRLKFLEQQS